MGWTMTDLLTPDLDSDFLSQRSEWMQLDREFQQKFLRYQRVHGKPGLFANWLIFGLCAIFCGSIWGLAIFGAAKLWHWIW